MKHVAVVSVCALLLAGAASGSDLNLKVRNYDSATVTATPGSRVRYAVDGELSDAQNEGLAMVCFDLSFSGGPLVQATTPGEFPMKNFASPLGLNNPQGYGGRIVAGALVQVGGAQNTINNTLAPKPTGTVIPHVAMPGQPVTLVKGDLQAPYQVGTYTLTPSNLFANVIRLGETGSPFWRVDGANLGTVQLLTVKVEAIFTATQTVSVGANGTQVLNLNAGPANAGRTYQVLGSTSGTTPGMTVGNGLNLPLNADTYFHETRTHPNSAVLQNSQGVLGPGGTATCVFHPNASFQGLTVNHAFILLGPIDFVSEAEPVQVVP